MRVIVWGMLLVVSTLIGLLFTELVTAGLNAGNSIIYTLTVALLTFCALSAIAVTAIVLILYIISRWG